MKKIYCIFLFLLIVSLTGCSFIQKETALTTKEKITEANVLNAPNNIKVDRGVITFDNADNAESYQLKVTQEGETLLTMTVSSGTDLSSFLDDGDYKGSLRSIKGNNKSEFTNEFDFYIGFKAKQVNEYNEFIGDELNQSDYINYSGRTYFDTIKKVMYFYYTASGFKVSFTGTKLEAKFIATNYNKTNSEARLVILVDGEVYPDEGHTLILNKDENHLYTLVEGLENKKHTVEVLKRTESADNTTALKYLKTDGNFESPESDKTKRILLIGASGSAGHGSIGSGSTKTTQNSDGLRAFPYLTARMYDTEIDEVNASGWGVYWGWNKQDGSENIPTAFKYVGIAQGASLVRKDYDYTKDSYDLIIVNLGMNDFNAYIKYASDDNQKADRINTYKIKVKAFYELLTSTYDCPIVILHTSNTNLSAEGVYNEEVASEVNTKLGTTRIYSIIIPANGTGGAAYGANSHANVKTHIWTADLIAEFIDTNLKWTKVRDNITYSSTRDLQEINVLN